MDDQKNPLHELLFATLKEQRAKRRWGIFFKLLFFAFIALFIAAIWLSGRNQVDFSETPHVALININGMIDEGSTANANDIISALHTAFKDSQVKAVILKINSPGGSPVDSSEIYREVMRLRTLHPNVKVYAVCGDMCTSAAYYIASSTNAIYANPASLVGSIGVLINGFGFVDSMNKLGVQRRLLTSGAHKGFLDPFSPINADDEKFAQTMLNDVHQQFIRDVEKGRGDRLKINADTFSGLAWTGQQALGLGLIDGYGSARDVARDVIKEKHMVDYTIKPSYFDQFANRIGASFATELVTKLGMQKIR